MQMIVGAGVVAPVPCLLRTPEFDAEMYSGHMGQYGNQVEGTERCEQMIRLLVAAPAAYLVEKPKYGDVPLRF